MAATAELTRLDAAIERGTRRLLELQRPDGIWVGELESNVTMTAQHLFWHHYLDLRTPELDRGIANELLEVRGRELVDRIAGQLTERLGGAELLWSRVSREPYATVALRPGVQRPGVETSRPHVARAGTWTETGWPATMESAVRSGRRAAQHILSSTSARVTA